VSAVDAMFRHGIRGVFIAFAALFRGWLMDKSYEPRATSCWLGSKSC